MNQKKILFIVIILTLSVDLSAKQIGSNLSAARQQNVFISESDTNNTLQGFSVFENGIILSNKKVSADFNALFPISDSLVLNGGRLSLKKDLSFRGNFKIGVGTIEGLGDTIDFPFDAPVVEIPSEGFSQILQEISIVNNKTVKRSVDVGASVNSLDWSYDGSYLAVASDALLSDDELQIYYFDGAVLTLTAAYNFGTLKNVNTVQWHPSDYYLLVGTTISDELEVLLFDEVALTITQTDVVNIGSVNAVSWSSDGNYIAIGQAGIVGAITVYEIASGILGSSYTFNFGLARTVQLNALSWDSTNNYIAVGLEANVSGDELKILAFDGSTITENATIELGATVRALAWASNESLLTIGLLSGDEKLRTYQHNGLLGTLSLVSSLNVGENNIVYSVDWDDDVNFLSVGTENDASGFEVKIYYFDRNDTSLLLVSGAETGSNVRAIRWSPDNTLLSAGTLDGMVYTFNFLQSPITFNNIRLSFNSDVNFRVPIRFEGICVLNGGGNVVDLIDTASFIITDGSTLRIEHSIIEGIHENKIHCTDDDGLLVLRDVIWSQDGNVTFSTGAIQFKQNVSMLGEYNFAYQTQKTSTILSRTTLNLDDGFTFSYDPIVIVQQDLLEFIDDTSIMQLKGATLHTTGTGMQLTKGSLIVKKDSFLSSEISESLDHGITLGNQISEDDIYCEIYNAQKLTLMQGRLNYKNDSSSSFVMQGNNTIFAVGNNAELYLFKSLNIGDGLLQLGAYSTLFRDTGVSIIGSIKPEASVSYI